MKKRIPSLCLCLIILCAALCSCTNTGIKFISQSERLQFNGNNISSADGEYWFDNDGMYYGGHAARGIRTVTEEGLTQVVGQCGIVTELQRYGDMIYYLDFYGKAEDDGNVRYVYYFHGYDTSMGKELINLRLDDSYVENEFYILNGVVYFVTREEQYGDKTLKIMSLADTQRVITANTDIFACGVVDGSLIIVKKTYDGFELLREGHADANDMSVMTFTDICNIRCDTEGIVDTVNFTSNSVIFMRHRYDGGYKESTSLLVYGFDGESVAVCDLGVAANIAVAFENGVFYTEYKRMYEENNGEFYDVSYLYHCDIKANKITELGEFEGVIDLFVTSDRIAYVTSNAFAGALCCTSSGARNNVLQYNLFYMLAYGYHD